MKSVIGAVSVTDRLVRVLHEILYVTQVVVDGEKIVEIHFRAHANAEILAV